MKTRNKNDINLEFSGEAIRVLFADILEYGTKTLTPLVDVKILVARTGGDYMNYGWSDWNFCGLIAVLRREETKQCMEKRSAKFAFHRKKRFPQVLKTFHL